MSTRNMSVRELMEHTWTLVTTDAMVKYAVLCLARLDFNYLRFVAFSSTVSLELYSQWPPYTSSSSAGSLKSVISSDRILFEINNLLCFGQGWDCYLVTFQAQRLGSMFLNSSFSALLCGDIAEMCFSRYLALLSFFHFTEFLFTAIANRRYLQRSSFLLTDSAVYWVAAGLSWYEFWVESHFFPEMKLGWISTIGVCGCLLGEAIRKLAMVHAGVAFTPRLATSKQADLVTDGIYSWFRHPGYAGWFIWSVSTQIVLCNPICAVLYFIASYRFFRHRVMEEERGLLQFFGPAYVKYQAKVPSGIPFVYGYPK